MEWKLPENLRTPSATQRKFMKRPWMPLLEMSMALSFWRELARCWRVDSSLKLFVAFFQCPIRFFPETFQSADIKSESLIPRCIDTTLPWPPELYLTAKWQNISVSPHWTIAQSPGQLSKMETGGRISPCNLNLRKPLNTCKTKNRSQVISGLRS